MKAAYTKHNPRIPIFYWIFGAAFFVLIGALAYRQLVLYEFYNMRVERQSMRRVIEPGARGDILDRNGKLLVTNEPFFTVGVYFNEIRFEFRKEYSRLSKLRLDSLRASGERKRLTREEVREISEQARANVLEHYMNMINGILGTDYAMSSENYNRHFANNPLLPFPLINELSAREHAILAEKIPVNSPIQIYRDTKRYYPYGEMAAHALGYVSDAKEVDTEGIPGDNLRTFSSKSKTGVTGVERVFDHILSGENGVKIWVIDLDGILYEKIMDVPPKKGKDVQTSLDIDLQQALEDSIGDRIGAGAVIDVKTGEVLALASHPTYNPNTLFKSMAEWNAVLENNGLLNLATSGRFPPGSTFKIVTAAAGLMAGAIDKETIVTCNGLYKVDSRMFPCSNRNGHGNLDLEEAIALSCNVYFYKTGIDTGVNALAATAKEFGLDSKTGIEIGETAFTVVPDREYKRKNGFGGWVNGDTANMSIGQGFLLQTPLQMACFAASFARKETRTKASIVHEPSRGGGLDYHGGEPIELTDDQYNTILNGMKAAVARGTCRRAAVEGVEIAAKSGTAQIPDGELGWMIAFAPADNPEIAMAVVIKGARNAVGGGRTSGPIVKAVMEEYFKKKAVVN